MKQPAMDELVPSFDPPEQWRSPDQKQRLTTEEWKALRDEIKARDNYTCRFCGLRSDYWMTADHADGDPTNDDQANLQTLCFWCHMVKHAGLWCVIYHVMDLYENPGTLRQVEVIRRIRVLREQGMTDDQILLELGLSKKVPFKQDHQYLRGKIAFITTRTYLMEDGRVMTPGHVQVRIHGRFVRAIQDPPAPSGAPRRRAISEFE